jgi:hypothetical protein
MGNAERLDPAHLVELYQRLPEDDKGALIHMVEHLARKADPVAWALDNAPEDDEPLTDEEIAAIEAAKAEYAEKGGISHEQLRAELGL